MSPAGDVMMVVLVALGYESLQPTTSRQHNQIQSFDPLWNQLSQAAAVRLQVEWGLTCH